MKIKVSKDSLEETPQPKIESSKDYNLPSAFPPTHLRKNTLQIKKEAEEAEREIVEKEKFWETPAFLRKKFKVQ